METHWRAYANGCQNTSPQWSGLFCSEPQAAAIVVTEFLRLSQKWNDVVVYTVMLFAVVKERQAGESVFRGAGFPTEAG